MDFSVLLGLISSGGLLFGRPKKRGAKEAWQTAAETYGLLHKPQSFWSGPKLSGPLFGNELTVDVKNRNTSSAATRFRLRTPSQHLGLKARKRGFWNSLGPRVSTGDRAFDSQVVVEGRNKLAVQEFLTPERRTAIRSLIGSFKGAVITDDEISLTQKGYVKKPDDMLGAIDAMTTVANALSEEAQGASLIQEAVVPAAAVATAAVAAGVALKPEPAAEWETAPEPEPELVAESEHEAAFEPERAPTDEFETERAEETALEPEPSDQSNELTAADESTDAEVEAPTPFEPLASQENSPGAEEFCAKVFAPGALSFTANQNFKESFEGERVAWTGTLESTTPFTFDFDFGSGGGTKAVLTILETEDAVSRNIEAVIGLPPGIDGLDDRIGQPVSFTGRLLKVDGLAKRIVIADAEIRP